MELFKELQKRQAEGRPIRVGLVGCGQMGSGFVHVTSRISGMTTAAISDIEPARPLAVLKSLEVDRDEIVVTNRPGEAEDALRNGRFLVTEDALLLPPLPTVWRKSPSTALSMKKVNSRTTGVGFGRPEKIPVVPCAKLMPTEPSSRAKMSIASRSA